MFIFDWLSKLDLNPLATLIAAFSGAWFAFLFESRRKVKEEKDRQRAVANRSIYVISEMWNVLYDYYQDVAKPYKDKSDAWLNMAADASYYVQAHFETEKLAFLLDLGEHQVYPKIMLEEIRFKSLIKLIEMRNSLLINQVHQALSRANVEVGTLQLTEEFIKSTIGIDTTHKFKKWTPEIIKRVESNLQSLKEAHDELRAAMKRLQPVEKFICLEFKEL